MATVNTPSAVVFASATEVANATDTYTKASGHGLTTGLKGQWSTSGVLPAGEAAGADRFAVVISATAVKFATSLANAIATPPVVVNITDDGTGNQTFTPTAIAGGVAKLQASNDPAALTDPANTNWSDVPSATANITATSVLKIEAPALCAVALRFQATLTAGRVSLDAYTNVQERN